MDGFQGCGDLKDAKLCGFAGRYCEEGSRLWCDGGRLWEVEFGVVTLSRNMFNLNISQPSADKIPADLVSTALEPNAAPGSNSEKCKNGIPVFQLQLSRY